MKVSVDALEAQLRPRAGWPGWATEAPYVAAAHPRARNLPPLEEGANCQRYAYAILGLFDRRVPPHRSSELWGEGGFLHIKPSYARDLDLALFSAEGEAWGAHVAVVLGGRLLHLCAEEGQPTIWAWDDFAVRDRYARVTGLVRVPQMGSCRD